MTFFFRDMEERFTYDLLNRLTGIVEGLDTTGVFAYDDYGRMTMKYIHGDTVFDLTAYNAGGRPHALMTARMHSYQPDMSMAYTSFDKLRQIQYDDFSLSYEYGYDHQRVRMVETLDSDTVFTKKYAGACEFVVGKDGQSSTLTYLSGPLGVFAVLDSHILPVGKGMYYVHPDHLGSWTTVTSSFLSVDNYVQDPSYTQNFNRYAYCMNNPLKYTDPDGEWAHLVIGALVGGIVNLASNWGHINTFGEGLAYFGIGAAAGAVGAATGGAAAGVFGTIGFVGASLTGVSSGFASGFVTGAGNAWLQGSSFGQGLLAGTKAGGMGAVMGGLTGGVMGGISAVRHGGGFWTGKGASFDFSVSDISDPYSSKYDSRYYKQHVDKYEAALKKGANEILDFKVGDLNVDRLSTCLESTDPEVMSKLGDYCLNENGYFGKLSGGEVYGTTVKSSVFNHSEVFVSPRVVDGYLFTYDIPHFHAVVGHELTHAYHIFMGASLGSTMQQSQSEAAALDCSKAIYNYYSDFRAHSITVPWYHEEDDYFLVTLQTRQESHRHRLATARRGLVRCAPGQHHRSRRHPRQNRPHSNTF